MNYLIDFKSTTTKEEKVKYLSQFDGIEFFKHFNTYLVTSDKLPTANGNIKSVSVDKTLNAEESATFKNNKENLWKTYSLRKSNYDGDVTTFEKYGENTVIYLMDSGSNNPNVTSLFSFNGDTSDKTNHSTTLEEYIFGLASPTIKSVKIFDENQQPKTSDIVRAMDIIIDDWKSHKLPSIVNCSWVIERNRYLEDKFQTMIDLGICVVAAAGNNGEVVDLYTPAAMKSVVTVGAYINSFNPTANCNTGVKDTWAKADSTSVAAAIASASFAYNASQVEDFNNRWQDLLAVQRTGLMEIAYTSHGSAANRVVTFENDEWEMPESTLSISAEESEELFVEDVNLFVVAAFSNVK